MLPCLPPLLTVPLIALPPCGVFDRLVDEDEDGQSVLGQPVVHQLLSRARAQLHGRRARPESVAAAKELMEPMDPPVDENEDPQSGDKVRAHVAPCCSDTSSPSYPAHPFLYRTLGFRLSSRPVEL